MSNDLNAMTPTEQARHAVRIIGGKDPLSDTQYNLFDADSDGRVGTRNYIWDPSTFQWIADTGNGATPEYDTIDLSYTGSDLTGVVYKLGGVTTSTLTLEYTDGNLTKVTRS